MFIDIVIIGDKDREECVAINTDHIVYIRDKDITPYGRTKKERVKEIGLVTGEKMHASCNEASKLRDAISK